MCVIFFFIDTAPTEISTLSLHDALPISIFGGALTAIEPDYTRAALNVAGMNYSLLLTRSSDFPAFAQIFYPAYPKDRKSTRLNSSHANISYAVFCLKKKKRNHTKTENVR